MMLDVRASVAWDGVSSADVAERCHVPRVELFTDVGSTLDVAHELAEAGAPAGTLVVADTQRAGRGRLRRAWSSEPGRGVWCTIVERPREGAVDLLSLRVGLGVAAALDSFAGERVGVKWPNDVVVRAGKVGGILAEARWSGGSMAWVAIGVGVNIIGPADIPGAAGLRAGVRRIDVLTAIVKAIRSAAAATGDLTDDESARYRERDVLRGRRVVSPAAGVVTGVAPSGALLVETTRGVEEHRAGTIRFAEDS